MSTADDVPPLADPPSRCVVDASVGVKLFVAEPLSHQAELVLGQLSHDPSAKIYVPDIFFCECANVLWKYVRRFGYPAQVARQNVADLRALTLRNVSTADLASDSLEIALTYGTTVYDASYVALSERLQLPLVTADEALIRKLADSPYQLDWLGDLPAGCSDPASSPEG